MPEFGLSEVPGPELPISCQSATHWVLSQGSARVEQTALVKDLRRGPGSLQQLSSLPLPGLQVGVSGKTHLSRGAAQTSETADILRLQPYRSLSHARLV